MQMRSADPLRCADVRVWASGSLSDLVPRVDSFGSEGIRSLPRLCRMTACIHRSCCGWAYRETLCQTGTSSFFGVIRGSRMQGSIPLRVSRVHAFANSYQTTLDLSVFIQFFHLRALRESPRRRIFGWRRVTTWQVCTSHKYTYIATSTADLMSG